MRFLEGSWGGMRAARGPPGEWPQGPGSEQVSLAWPHPPGAEPAPLPPTPPTRHLETQELQAQKGSPLSRGEASPAGTMHVGCRVDWAVSEPSQCWRQRAHSWGTWRWAVHRGPASPRAAKAETPRSRSRILDWLASGQLQGP